MAGREVEWEEVQEIVLNGYREKPVTQYYFLEIIDAAAARAWLLNNLPQLSFGNDRSTEDLSLFVAFTLTGLAKIGLPKDALDTFPWDFRDGMTSRLRRRILSDVGPNDPSKWRWGGCKQQTPHILILAYATEKELAACTQKLEQGWGTAFQILEKPIFGQRHDDNREHFGFADGLSQPAIDTSPRSRRLLERADIASIIQPGEFILGYLNERGQLPVSPSISFVPGSKLHVITHADRSDSGYPPNTTFPRLDFGRNGSFLVFRQLQQNVHAFAELLAKAANDLGESQTRRLSDEVGVHRLIAAKMIGRWDDGTSLALEPNSPPPEGRIPNTVNNFSYAEEDRYGLRCPIGAHVRRANPRDTRDDDPKLASVRTKRHRLIRRGRIYGPRTFDSDSGWYAWDTKEKLDDCEERGLHFVAINASIESQFEFVQQTWMNTPIFGDLNERDPLIGTPDGGDKRRFTIQGTPINRRFWWEEPLVTVRGGAYFFLPSHAALKFLASDRLIAAVQAKTANHTNNAEM
jgi:deferrochelatase/peroxidase EfeB